MMTSPLDTVIDCADIAMNCDHTVDPVGMVCWTCAMKMVSIAEAAEAALQAVMTRAAQAEAERDAFSVENEAIHRAVNEMCGTDTSTIEAVQHVIDERDAIRADMIVCVSDARKMATDLYHAQNERDEARRALRLLATDPITLGLSAHYRATCSGAYRESDKRIDPLENAINILGIDAAAIRACSDAH